MSFIERKGAERRSPFFMYFCSHHTHTPAFAKANFTNTSIRGWFGDHLRTLDWSVGEIVQAVDRSVSHAYAMKFELEREREQQRLARRDRAAEARLNHLIKGKCGGASMLLEALRSRLGSDSPLGRELELPIGMLVMAGDWCTCYGGSNRERGPQHYS